MKPRADLTTSERQALVGAFDRAVRENPSVRDVRVGRRLIHGAAYEHTAPDSADFIVSIAFDDLSGLQAYLRHPTHEELGVRYYESMSAGAAYDFEVDGLAGLTRLTE